MCMASETPRIDGLNAEKLAELASRYVREGDESTRTDFQAAAFTQATACAGMAILSEVHQLRKAIEAMQE